MASSGDHRTYISSGLKNRRRHWLCWMSRVTIIGFMRITRTSPTRTTNCRDCLEGVLFCFFCCVLVCLKVVWVLSLDLQIDVSCYYSLYSLLFSFLALPCGRHDTSIRILFFLFKIVLSLLLSFHILSASFLSYPVLWHGTALSTKWKFCNSFLIAGFVSFGNPKISTDTAVCVVCRQVDRTTNERSPPVS